jgi:hypothetical protein
MAEHLLDDRQGDALVYCDGGRRVAHRVCPGVLDPGLGEDV